MNLLTTIINFANNLFRFKPKIRAELRENYHEEPLYQTRFDEDLTVLEQMLALTKARLVANELPQKLLQHADKLWDEKEQKQQVIDVSCFCW